MYSLSLFTCDHANAFIYYIQHDIKVSESNHNAKWIQSIELEFIYKKCFLKNKTTCTTYGYDKNIMIKCRVS